MTGIYEDIEKLYELLADEKCNLNNAKAILLRLKKRGVDKKFIKTMLRTIGMQQIVQEIYDSLETRK